MTGTDDRERRLADALRANLRRRKAQARGEEAEPATSPDAPAPAETPPGDPPLKPAR